MTTVETFEGTRIAGLGISPDGRVASTWRRLPSPALPIPSWANVIGGRYLIWSEALYDLRTGRTVAHPAGLYKPWGEARIVPAGRVVGDWYSLGDTLFNPATRTSIPVTTAGTLGHPQDHEAGERCDYLGGPTLVRRCYPKDKVNSRPPSPVASRTSGGPDVYEVLRVEGDATGDQAVRQSSNRARNGHAGLGDA